MIEIVEMSYPVRTPRAGASTAVMVVSIWKAFSADAILYMYNDVNTGIWMHPAVSPGNVTSPLL